MFGFTATSSQPLTPVGLKKESQGKGKAASPSDFFQKSDEEITVYSRKAVSPYLDTVSAEAITAQTLFDKEERKNRNIIAYSIGGLAFIGLAYYLLK